jgi:tetratricopeptide (TPR) repeat protein
LPQVYDFYQLGSQVFTVMDFIEGYSLQQHMDFGYAFDEKTIKIWLRELLEVLSYLHGQAIPIIHSDIKPGNIMITPEAHVCLIDFNISLGGDDNTDILGFSEKYAAPEQVMKVNLLMSGYDHSHIRIGKRSDIYSLGKSFYELMRLGTEQGLAYTEAMWSVINMATAENVEDRHVSADKMRERLLNLRKLDTRYRQQRRATWLLHTSYGVCLILAILLLYFGYGKNSAELYETKLDEIQVLAESHSAMKLITAGTNLLNTERLAKVAKRDADEYAWIIHAVGDGYFEEGNYSAAAEYYEDSLNYAEAAELMRYYSDFAIAEARAGHMRLAKEILERAKGAGVSDNALALVSAEILMETGDTETATSLLLEVGAGSDSEMSKRAYLYLADAYKDGLLGKANIAAAIECLEKIDDRDDVLVQRKLGEVYGLGGRYDAALSSYLKLCKRKNPSLPDSLNLAICYDNVGNFSKGIAVLESLKKEYPDDYMLVANLAIIYYDSYLESGNEKELASASKYYKESKRLYRNAENQAEASAVMDTLNGIFG